ncbi:MAG: hypothetical protein ACJ790_01380 [Myxococcaceae bacterium]
MDEAERLWNEGNARAAGKLLFERLAPEDRPNWAGAVLFAATVGMDLPKEVNEVFRCCFAPAAWPEAKEAFQAVRGLSRQPQDVVETGMLLLAENCAKVAYNASNPADPFDANAGELVAACAADLLRHRGGAQELSNLIRAAVFFLY